MSRNKRLSTKKHRAIAALLTESSTEAAAVTAGVAASTIYRWLQTDAQFCRALAEAETAVVADAAREIATASREAITILRAVFRDKTARPRDKVAAANSILSHLPSVRLLGSIEAAIEELKQNESKSG